MFVYESKPIWPPHFDLICLEESATMLKHIPTEQIRLTKCVWFVFDNINDVINWTDPEIKSCITKLLTTR